MIQVYSDREFQLIRAAAKIVAGVHEMIAPEVAPGVTTGHLNKLIDTFIRDHGAVPSFIGVPSGRSEVPPFPAAACISINSEVVHGIPGTRVLQEGDIVGIDVGTVKDGYYGDAARTYPVGEIKPELQRLLKVTKMALDAGIAAARAGNRVGDIGAAVQSVVDPEGFGIVREMVGHGVGKHLHEPPEIPNYGRPGNGPLIKKGMCFALEPMINLGAHRIHIASDGWTIVTQDGSPSAHFENQIQITDDEPIILTEL